MTHLTFFLYNLLERNKQMYNTEDKYLLKMLFNLQLDFKTFCDIEITKK